MEKPGAELASLLPRSATWAARLYHFNFQPANYIHASRRKDFTSVFATDEVWMQIRARPALSAHILASLGSDGEPCFDLAHQEWPLLLLNASQLDRLVRHVAATLHSTAIARCIEQHELGQWKLLLGADGYKFALHGTRLLPDFGLRHSNATSVTALNDAYAWIEAALSKAPTPLLVRGRLKLPAGIAQHSVDQETAQQLIFAILLILDPKWRSSFAEFKK